MPAKRAKMRVPVSMTEVEALARKVSEHLIERETIHAHYEEAISELEAARDRALKVIDRRAIVLGARISAYARHNKKQLPNTFTVGGSEMGWRAVAPSVLLTDKEKVIVERAISLGFEEFIRYTPSLNRSEMKKRPVKASRIPGVKVRGDLTFFIKPGGCELRLVRSSRTKKVSLVRPRRERAEGDED